MEPHPQVPHQEPDRHVQEPHCEPRRRRPNPTLVHLAIAGLDPESAPVGVLDPIEPLGADAPVGVDPGLPALLAAAPRRFRHLTQICTVAVRFRGSLRVYSNQPLRFIALKTCEPLGPSGWSGLRPWPTTGIRNGSAPPANSGSRRRCRTRDPRPGTGRESLPCGLGGAIPWSRPPSSACG